MLDLLKSIRERWHHDLRWREYNGYFYSNDSQSSNQIRSWIQNEYLINTIGLERIKTLSQYQYLSEIRRLLSIHSPLGGHTLCRMGKDGDGGYIMVRPFSEQKIAYSFGINNDVSWDEALASYGYDIYMYDHTIKHLPFKRREFHWKKCGITGKNEKRNLKMLSTLIYENYHGEMTGMLLKMDVEGYEWDVFNNISTEELERFDQIVIEMHGFLDFKKREGILKALNRINSVFRCVHVHPNNNSRVEYVGDLVMADTLEITWLNTKYDMIPMDDVILPIDIDQPCTSRKMDVLLGKW